MNAHDGRASTDIAVDKCNGLVDGLAHGAWRGVRCQMAFKAEDAKASPARGKFGFCDLFNPAVMHIVNFTDARPRLWMQGETDAGKEAGKLET